MHESPAKRFVQRTKSHGSGFLHYKVNDYHSMILLLQLMRCKILSNFKEKAEMLGKLNQYRTDGVSAAVDCGLINLLPALDIPDHWMKVVTNHEVSCFMVFML